jgi:transcriptional regulator with XRE-family HTH domain
LYRNDIPVILKHVQWQSSMKADKDTFGPRLRQERERRGITLKHVADSTKIKESLFAELERGDFSKWPQGIFRRAHLCAYLSAIGLPPQPTLAEFTRLFPDESTEPLDPLNPANPLNADGCADASQVAGASKASTGSQMANRVWVVLFDLGAVCAIASLVAGIAGVSVWFAVAAVGLAYSAVGSACFSQTIGAYLQTGKGVAPRTRQVTALAPSYRAPAQVDEVRRIAPEPDRSASLIPEMPEMIEEPELLQRRASA